MPESKPFCRKQIELRSVQKVGCDTAVTMGGLIKITRLGEYGLLKDLYFCITIIALIIFD